MYIYQLIYLYIEDAAMAHADIDYIKRHLGAWLAEPSLSQPPVVHEIEPRERRVGVEEELKHPRAQMQQGFALMEKRFEQIDPRFEQIDRRRFEDMIKRHDQHFFWLVGFIATRTGLVIAALRFL